MNQDRPLAPTWRNDVPDFALLVRRGLWSLRRNLAVLLLGSVLVGALATLLAMQRPDYYYASSAILIDPRLGGSGDAAAPPTIYLADALVVDSEIEVLRSGRLLRRVLTRLQGDTTLPAMPRTTDDEPLTPQEEEAAQIAWLDRNLTVERQGNTFVILIGFTAEDPDLAAAVANAVAEEYVLFQQDDSRNRVQQESAWLSNEIARLSLEAREAEAAVQRFLVENDVPKDDETGLVGATMADVEAEIVDQQRVLRRTTLFMAQIETDIQRLENDRPIGELLSLRPENATLTRLMQQYKEVQLSDADNDAVIDRTVRQMLSELSSMREATDATREITEANLERLQTRHAELQAQLSQIAATQIELGNLQRESDAVKEQQRRIMGQLQQSRSQDLYVVGDTRVIDDAIPPTSPANPPLPLVLAGGLLGGLLLAMAWVFVRAQMDDRIRDPQALRDRLDLAYLGTVPRGATRSTVPADPATLAAGRTAQQRQLYDSLRRTAVLLRRDRSVTMITSVAAGRDRTMLSATLAAFLAGQGERVLLVAGDPADRRLLSVFGPGMADPVPLNADLALAQPAEGLSVALPQAGRPVDPVGYSAAIAALLAEHGDEAGIVLIDGPILSGAAEEMVDRARVDRVLLALPFGQVSLNALAQMLDRSPGIGRRLAGAFLTQVPRRGLFLHDMAAPRKAA
ncbi:hypothetical protein JHW45_17050 [Paracoccus stylophorae]|uniref:Tyrosine-protein kinase G-rich domain-containing protein n=1 Tax=Paracoccus stylophorae TaxID=659350 RepID=A0ABY7SW60_9RHOB|nr:GNVR domain-containing protein [Paracoccus stylophorae]WCR10718.1 hypothetical protein JHW45_17050 [Paracoccus stylophorae]